MGIPQLDAVWKHTCLPAADEVDLQLLALKHHELPRKYSRLQLWPLLPRIFRVLFQRSHLFMFFASS